MFYAAEITRFLLQSSQKLTLSKSRIVYNKIHIITTQTSCQKITNL